jgi:hypothetical protein
MTIFDQDAPLTRRDFYLPSEKSIKGYHRRNRERAEKIAASMKRALTQFTILGMLSLSAALTAAQLHA